MTYDSGNIAKGVWNRGVLKVKVASSSERYEPYVMEGYQVGELERVKI